LAKIVKYLEFLANVYCSIADNAIVYVAVDVKIASHLYYMCYSFIVTQEAAIIKIRLKILKNIKPYTVHSIKTR